MVHVLFEQTYDAYLSSCIAESVCDRCVEGKEKAVLSSTWCALYWHAVDELILLSLKCRERFFSPLIYLVCPRIQYDAEIGSNLPILLDTNQQALLSNCAHSYNRFATLIRWLLFKCSRFVTPTQRSFWQKT